MELNAARAESARQTPGDTGWTDEEKSAFHSIFKHYGKRFVLYKQQAPVRACVQRMHAMFCLSQGPATARHSGDLISHFTLGCMHMNQQDNQEHTEIGTFVADLSGKTLDQVERYYRLHYKRTDEYLEGIQTKANV